jgi:LmbE family N-acetylglucosaminyl deacetylase
MEAFPEDWSRALAVVAHPDDMEYGAASAVARWTGQGKDIRYVLVTSGEAGIGSMAPDVVGPLREDEQRASCAVVGVSVVEFLGHPDGLVVADVTLRRDLAAAIRRHQPEFVLSINFREHFAGGAGWNHADHRATGLALLDAVRDAANPWLSPEAGAPWSGVRGVAFNASPHASHYVDIAATMDAGIASLECHRVYLDNLGNNMADAATFLRGGAAAQGEPLGLELATTFEIIGA